MDCDVNIYPRDCNKQVQKNLNILIKNKSCIDCLFFSVKKLNIASVFKYCMILDYTADTVQLPS